MKEQGIQQDIRSTVTELGAFLADRKARDILAFDVRGLTSMTDYFLICTVNSTVHGRAVVRDVYQFMRERGMRPLSRESGFDSPWVLLDYNFFIVHVFLEEAREYYQLEKLWSDAATVYQGGEK
jgi:ribosome-associated protein